MLPHHLVNWAPAATGGPEVPHCDRTGQVPRKKTRRARSSSFTSAGNVKSRPNGASCKAVSAREMGELLSASAAGAQNHESLLPSRPIHPYPAPLWRYFLLNLLDIDVVFLKTSSSGRSLRP